jgi:hypothetical protein
MRGAIPLLPQYAFMAWCLVKHRDYFTFTLYYWNEMCRWGFKWLRLGSVDVLLWSRFHKWQRISRAVDEQLNRHPTKLSQRNWNGSWLLMTSWEASVRSNLKYSPMLCIKKVCRIGRKSSRLCPLGPQIEPGTSSIRSMKYVTLPPATARFGVCSLSG